MVSPRAQRLAGIFALLSLALAVLILARPHFTNASRPPRGIGDSIVGIQVIQTLGEAEAILSDAPSPDREVMRIKQLLDFGFIAAYAGLFITLAFLLTSHGSWFRIAGIIAGICGLAAAVFDVVEDFATLRILDLSIADTTPRMLNEIRSAAAAKWVLWAVTLALLSIYFLRDARWTHRVIGGLMLLAAVLQIYGLADNVWLVRQAYVLGAALIGIVMVFFRVR